MSHRRGRLLLFLCAVLLVVVNCAQEQYPLALWEEQHPAPDAGTATAKDAAAAVQGPILCTQARAESIPARWVAMSGDASTPTGEAIEPVFVSSLFQDFLPVCGNCHVSASLGGFHVSSATDFAAQMTPKILAHVTQSVCIPGAVVDSTNPDDPMPPCGGPNAETYSKRTTNDPVRTFAVLVQEWFDAGSPPASFTPGAADSGAGGDASDAGSPVSPYLMNPAVGNAMTEIGNCIPSALATVEDPKSAALDKMFAGLKADPTASGPEAVGLPESLSETDLFTFDSSTLAQYRVIAYAPGYPLWSDNAYKLRHVRVPYGTSIHFNKTTQQFDIPPNTRFYKTFTKQIIDTDGSYRYRKIETRLIVSRPDSNNSDGTAKAIGGQTALFGTYQWCAASTNVPCPPGAPDESEAYLVTQPLTSEEPFADTLLLYNTDELLAADILRGQPADPEGALLQVDPVAGHPAARHYAIPSSQRCMQCHMGSPSESFILGFTPLQIHRRPTGVGGVIEDAAPDELTQLQRFIDAGIVTGIDSPSDVLLLEQTQGARVPRNDYELVAQGYAMGNCQHCHNPRGFPSVQDTRLKDVLDFLPGPTGGIFQFPLERYSPAIGRGLAGSTPIPYITPSLVDLPRLVTTAGGSGGAVTGSPAGDIFVSGGGASSPPTSVIYAPWRSLIYRNVDAAFAYTDDVALFPHMPFNTPGYDPRAKQIFGDWMVSIPAVRKHPEIVEYAYQTSSDPADNIGSPVVDATPQPYVEMTPGAPGYEEALAAATGEGPSSRLSIFQSGINPALPVAAPPGDGGAPLIYSRYADLGDTDDIEDPSVLADPACHPIPTAAGPPVPYPFPNHPHWVITDTSQPPPPWQPRNTNWPAVLVEQEPPPLNNGCGLPTGQQSAYDDQLDAIDLLQTATLDQVQAYATALIPFGLWQPNASCNFSSVPSVDSYAGASRPHWMDYSDSLAKPPVAPPASDAPVYLETPGAAIFKMICINCHGPDADANGRLAANLATMTGGSAQVADFRDGLFGPVSAPDSNIERAFGPGVLPSMPTAPGANWTGVTPDDRAARYMPWMALGGTGVTIPEPILQIVAVTDVLGARRFVPSSALSANMLSEAKELCYSLFGPTYAAFEFTPGAQMVPGVPISAGSTRSSVGGYLDPSGNLNGTILPQNGDAELWLHLCSMANPSPVHILRPGLAYSASAESGQGLGVAASVDATNRAAFDSGEQSGYSLVDSAIYPVGVPVGNEWGLSVVPSNGASGSDWPDWPWCVDDTRNIEGEPSTVAQVQWIAENNFPVCPCNVKTTSQTCNQGLAPSCGSATPIGTCFGNDAANKWAVRGAINAGMSVFLYVKSIETTGPAPDYDQCPK